MTVQHQPINPPLLLMQREMGRLHSGQVLYAIERRYWARCWPSDGQLTVLDGAFPSVDGLGAAMLPLCVGVAVILTEPLEAVTSAGLARVAAGSRGRVVGFVVEPLDGQPIDVAAAASSSSPASLPMLPAVQFEGLAGTVRVVRRTRWHMAVGDAELCVYEQLPLTLGWACYDGQVCSTLKAHVVCTFDILFFVNKHRYDVGIATIACAGSSRLCSMASTIGGSTRSTFASASRHSLFALLCCCIDRSSSFSRLFGRRLFSNHCSRLKTNDNRGFIIIIPIDHQYPRSHL
jgi:hypothetical protein